MDYGAIATIVVCAVGVAGTMIGIAWRAGWLQRNVEANAQGIIASSARFEEVIKQARRDLERLERDVEHLKIGEARRDEAIRHLNEFRTELLGVVTRLTEKINGL